MRDNRRRWRLSRSVRKARSQTRLGGAVQHADRSIMNGMPKKASAASPETEPENVELSRFTKLARALFGVDRKDVDKHEPVKRLPRTDQRQQ